MRLTVRVLFFVLLAAGPEGPSRYASAAQPGGTAPESFTAAMQPPGGAAVNLVILIDRYAKTEDRTKMTTALNYGGYTAFLEALRRSPAVGSVTLGQAKATLRWTKEETASVGRLITVVADTPLPLDAGGNAATTARDAPVMVIELRMDNSGRGTGTMVPAARLTPNAFVGASIVAGSGTRYALTGVAKVTP